ncbi:Hypothetical protein NCS54_01473300 [Fusarium falciforme]|uniref:Hypothetical protein n=1 Tax=Fusarium falciforme TaxID=195108 RepID=UPI0022FFC4E1|nr:Hypothetical protein NCS54_01473300 [Fusarium falciforme]WAO97029.1 Hypothetical protein NCS54_01473300 [Fusarium falciforme]
MGGTSNLNSTMTNDSDAGSSGSPILGVIAAVAVVVVVLRAIVQCMLNQRKLSGAQGDSESRGDVPNGTTGLQTLNSTSPAQDYKIFQSPKSQLSSASHKFNSSEV